MTQLRVPSDDGADFGSSCDSQGKLTKAKVDQVVEVWIWNGDILELGNIALQLGWDGWLHWHAVPLR